MKCTKLSVVLLACLLLGVLPGCGGDDDDDSTPERVEGQEAGDCSDAADNDLDGLFDCDDDGCSGSPDCAGDDDTTGDDDDTSGDDDSAGGDDDDSAGGDDDDTSSAGPLCTADFTVDFPDGTSTTLDGCLDWSVQSLFDYLPSDPPEFVSFTLNLGATTSAGFDCEVTIVQQGLCGTGYYDAADTANHTTTYALADCAGVGASYRQTYTASGGYLHLDTLDSGSVGGDFTGLPLATTVGGYLAVDDGIGVSLSGNFSLTLEQVVGAQVSPGACVVSDGDADGDGAVAEYFGGTDCDDSDPNNFGGNTELCDGSDNDCVGGSDFTTSTDDGGGEVDSDGDGSLDCEDCDDGDSSVSPQAAELCDGVDNDCDSQIDEDGDGDGFGVCDGDCDDNDVDINPGEWDDCSNYVDDDCDGYINDDTAGPYEMWEPGLSSGAPLNLTQPVQGGTSTGPLPPGLCTVQADLGPATVVLEFSSGSGSASGNFSSGPDVDIWELATDPMPASWGTVLSFLQAQVTPGIPDASSGCYSLRVSWNASDVVQVSIEHVGGSSIGPSSGTTGSLALPLGFFDVLGQDFRIRVEQISSWLPDPFFGNCYPTYFLTVDLP